MKSSFDKIKNKSLQTLIENIPKKLSLMQLSKIKYSKLHKNIIRTQYENGIPNETLCEKNFNISHYPPEPFFSECGAYIYYFETIERKNGKEVQLYEHCINPAMDMFDKSILVATQLVTSYYSFSRNLKYFSHIDEKNGLLEVFQLNRNQNRILEPTKWQSFKLEEKDDHISLKMHNWSSTSNFLFIAYENTLKIFQVEENFKQYNFTYTYGRYFCRLYYSNEDKHFIARESLSDPLIIYNLQRSLTSGNLVTSAIFKERKRDESVVCVDFSQCRRFISLGIMGGKVEIYKWEDYSYDMNCDFEKRNFLFSYDPCKEGIASLYGGMDFEQKACRVSFSQTGDILAVTLSDNSYYIIDTNPTNKTFGKLLKHSKCKEGEWAKFCESNNFLAEITRNNIKILC